VSVCACDAACYACWPAASGGGASRGERSVASETRGLRDGLRRGPIIRSMGAKQRKGKGGAGGHDSETSKAQKKSAPSSYTGPAVVAGGLVCVVVLLAVASTGWKSTPSSTVPDQGGDARGTGTATRRPRRQLNKQGVQCGVNGQEHFSEVPAMGMHILVPSGSDPSCSSGASELSLDFYVDGIEAEKSRSIKFPCTQSVSKTRPWPPPPADLR
jgi:hypothetical protein